MHKFKHKCADCVLWHKVAGVQINTSTHQRICGAGLVWFDGSLVTALHRPVHQSVHPSARPSVSAETKRPPALSSAGRLNLLHFTAERQYCNTATCELVERDGWCLITWCLISFKVVAFFYTATYGAEVGWKMQTEYKCKLTCNFHILKGINLIPTCLDRVLYFKKMKGHLR